MTTFFTFLLLPLLLVVAVVLWATESREQRIRRWVSNGMSQRAVAKRLGVSRYQVTKALMAA
jgi:DNA invertase Pin-like site-specific DNA recombinase